MSVTATYKHTLSEPDESTRLLADEEHDGYSIPSQPKRPTPLPKNQLSVLLAVRIVDPIAYTQIFPYINQLLSDLHIAAPDQVGFYSGFIESAYSLAQMISVYQLGRLSDVVGRRPVVIFSLVGIAISTFAFGWSTSLPTMLASRFLGGSVAGNIAVLHSFLVEITDDTNQNIAVPIYSLGWSTGAIIGPLIGGTFANAATRYPKYFSWPIFIERPYLPPSIIGAMCALLGTLLGYLFMEETLPSKRKTCVLPDSAPPSASGVDISTTVPEPPSMKTLLTIQAMRALTLSGFALSFLASAFDVVFTLFCYSPVDAGGLGLQPSTIGNFLAFANTVAVLLRLIAMPYILRRFDYATIYNVCAYLWPITFAFLPLFNLLARARLYPEASTGTSIAEVAIWIGLCVVLGLSKVAAIPFSVTMLLIKRHAPAPSAPVTTYSDEEGSGIRTGPASASKPGSGSALGRSNGLVQFAMCLGRAIGPVVVSTLFTALNGSTWARRWGVGPTWAVVMAVLAMLGANVTRRLR